MGNSCSSYANGGIYVQTDQPYYIAGDTVTGKVHVSILDSFPANVLTLKIKGYEESFWQEQRTRTHTVQGADGQEKTHTETYYESYRGKNTFFSHRFPLYVWNMYSYMPAGQYTFPFQFKLMDTLPGTYQETGIERGGDYKAIIKYKVKVEIESSGHKKLKNRQDLIVREPLKNMVSAQYGERVVKPNTWCCIGQGTSHIKCHFERNSYLPGETARMLADLNNSECDLAIKNLQCSLNKRLRLTSNTGREILINRQVARRDFQGVAARQSAVDQNRRNCELALTGSNGIVIQPTTKGRLINCEYNLNVLAHLEGCICCTAQPEVTVPIAIISPPPPNYGVQTAPPNWNPQVFEVKSFAFTSDCMYTKSMPGSLPVPAMNVNISMPPPMMNAPVNPMPPPMMNMNVNMNANQQGGYQDPNQVNMGIGMGAPGMQMNVQVSGNDTGYVPPPPNMNMQVKMNVNEQVVHQESGNVNMGIGMGVPGMQMNVHVNDNNNNGFQNNNQVNMGIGMGAPAMNMNVTTTTTTSNNGYYQENNNVNMGVDMGMGAPGMQMNFQVNDNNNNYNQNQQPPNMNMNMNFNAGGGF